MFLFNTKQYQCPFDCFIDILKGKWRTNILLSLAEGPKHFAVLQKCLNGISAKVLSENLQLLEENKILSRKVYPTVPPTVEYSLTEEGMALIGIMDKINIWTNLYLKNEDIIKI